MTTCAKCIKARRALINALPKPIAAPLAKIALPTVTTADEVIRVARSYLGVPFLHQGRSRNGLDCVGLPIVVLRDLSCVPNDFEITDYPRQPYKNQLEDRLKAHCTPLPGPIPGSLVSIRWKRELAHVAICTGDTLIHAFEWRQSVIEHGFRGRWLQVAVGYWAMPGVRYG